MTLNISGIKMVVGTAVAVGGIAAVVSTGGAAAPVVAAAAEGVVAGMGATTAAVGGTATGVAVGASTAAATTAGAITGAGVAAGATGATATAVGTAAATSAGVAGSAALGVGGTGAGTAAAVSGGLALGPIGWIALGAEAKIPLIVSTNTGVSHIKKETSEHITSLCQYETNIFDQNPEYTFDCWKPVLHDESEEPSKGKLLREVVAHPNIKQVIMESHDDGQLKELLIENVWDEKFRIDFVILPSQQLAAHAVLL